MRQTGHYSSNLSSKASLLTETLQVMRELADKVPLESIKNQVFQHDLFLKRTLATRKSVWETIYTRFISERDPQELYTLARITASPLPERDRYLVLFYELARSLPLIYDLTVNCLYNLYMDGRSSCS